MTQLTKKKTKPKSASKDLLLLAIQGGAGVAELQEIKAILKERQRLAYAKAYVEMKPKLPLVLKTKTNEQTDSSYAPIEDINAKVEPILHKYGFALAGWDDAPAQTEKHVTIKITLLHKGGHFESVSCTMPLDVENKTDVHATGSAITYARRYAVCTLLNISTGDNDAAVQPVAKTDNAKQESPEEKRMRLLIQDAETIEELKSYEENVPESLKGVFLEKQLTFLNQGKQTDLAYLKEKITQ